MKQVKLNGVLWVLEKTPYTLTNDTDSSVIYVDCNLYDEFKELNPDLELTGYNYRLLAKKDPVYWPYIFLKDDAAFYFSDNPVDVSTFKDETYSGTLQTPITPNDLDVDLKWYLDNEEIDDTNITLSDAGNYTISAAIVDSSLYDDEVQSYVLNYSKVKRTATLSFDETSQSAETYKDETFTATIQTLNGVPTGEESNITFYLNNEEISGNSVTLSAAGTYTIKAELVSEIYETTSAEYTITYTQIKRTAILTFAESTISANVEDGGTYQADIQQVSGCPDGVTVNYYLDDALLSGDSIVIENIAEGEYTHTVSAKIENNEYYEDCEASYTISIVAEASTPDKQYMTFEPLEDGTFTFTNDINYRINGGQWTELAANTATPTIPVGSKISWKGNLTPSTTYSMTKPNYGIGMFSSTGVFDAYGNIMSLLYGDNFKEQYSLNGNYTFYQTFCNSKVVNTENLILPATTLGEYCYSRMFQGCTSLTQAPKLPAMNLAENCYCSMFWNCTSLIIPPELPAMSLSKYCYTHMFDGCTSLTTAPALPATNMEMSVYSYMFQGCTSLTTSPDLLAGTAQYRCYIGMFSGCSNLNYIKMTATSFRENSYTSPLDQWVKNVAATGTFIKSANAEIPTGISGIPSGWIVKDENGIIYPSITISNSNMPSKLDQNESYTVNKSDFVLTINPSEAASEVSMYYSYDNTNWVAMPDTFDLETSEGGSIILYTKAEITNSEIYADTTHTQNFTYTVEEPASEGDTYAEKFLTFTPSTDAQFKYSQPIEYSIDGIDNWVSLNANTNTPTISAGHTIKWKKTSTAQQGRFTATGNFVASGNVMSLVHGNSFNNQTSLSTYQQFYALFMNNTYLTNAENLILPATTLSQSCYSSMFEGCSALTTAPELPATTLASNCYQSMFNSCSSLTTAPELPATTLSNGCYLYMFLRCSSLNSIKAMFTTTPSNTYTERWVEGVAATGTFVKNPDATWNVVGTSGVPTGWTITTPTFSLTSNGWDDYPILKNSEISISPDEFNLESDYDETATLQYSLDGETYSDFTSAVTLTTSANSTLYVKASLTNGVDSICQCDYTVADSISEGDTYYEKYFTFSPNDSAMTFQSQKQFYYSIDGGTTWTLLDERTNTPSIPAGGEIKFKRDYTINSGGIGKFSVTSGSGTFNVYGNIQSLIWGDNFKSKKELRYTYQYRQLFIGNTYIKDASNLILPATKMTDYAYSLMFNQCTALTKAPTILPATTLASNCYQGMFGSCPLLRKAPELPALELVSYCYTGMFSNCSSLHYIKAMFLTKPIPSYTNWVSGVAESGTFVKNPDATWDVTGVNGVPSGWTITTTTPPSTKEDVTSCTITSDGWEGNTYFVGDENTISANNFTITTTPAYAASEMTLYYSDDGVNYNVFNSDYQLITNDTVDQILYIKGKIENNEDLNDYESSAFEFLYTVEEYGSGIEVTGEIISMPTNLTCNLGESMNIPTSDIQISLSVSNGDISEDTMLEGMGCIRLCNDEMYSEGQSADDYDGEISFYFTKEGYNAIQIEWSDENYEVLSPEQMTEASETRIIYCIIHIEVSEEIAEYNSDTPYEMTYTLVNPN